MLSLSGSLTLGLGPHGSGGGAPGPSPSATLSAPVLSLTGPADTYPPPLAATFDETAMEGDTLRFQSSASVTMSSPIIDASVLLDSTAISSGTVAIPGLSGITSPTETFFQAWLVEGANQANPGDYGPLSNILKHGDVTAPTITSADNASGLEGVANPTGTVTASEPATFAITGGADAATFSIDSATGEWTLNATPVFATQSSYSVEFTATDLGGNASAPQAFTFNVQQVLTASTFSSVHKSSFLTLSGGDLTVTSNLVADGSPRWVRSTGARGGRRYFEMTVTSGLDGSFARFAFIGVANASADMTTLGSPPGANCTAVRSDANTVYEATGGTPSAGVPTFTNNDVIGVLFDIDLGKVWFSKNGAFFGTGHDPATDSGGYALPTGSELYAAIGLIVRDDGARSATADFSHASPPASALEFY